VLRHLQQYFSHIVAVRFIDGGHHDTQRKALTSQVTGNTYCCIKYTSPCTRRELTTLEVIGTDCTGSCTINHNGRCWKLFTRHGSPTTTPNRVPLVAITCMWSFIRDRIIVDLFVLCNQQTCKFR
jgi:hypothetical protein